VQKYSIFMSSGSFRSRKWNSGKFHRTLPIRSCGFR